MQGRPAAMILAMAYLLLFFFFLHFSSSTHGANLPATAGDPLLSTMAHRRLLRSMMLQQHSYVPDETTTMIQQLLGGPSPRPQPGGGVPVSPLGAAAAEQTPKMAPAPLPRGPTTADLITDDRPGRGEVDIGVDYTPPKSHPPQHN
ncbi:hypothetical protein BRADI_3g16657v3 [Brachypodium distachyon]|uniref:Uncharacterized protein n=1 Tax=Brachypodium distachyon TaxID=15368 RepID=A0A2K2CXL5_BRADI|nr:hypothetical protein BRADI_3g16657v3 [Brachypodium distachyon]